MEQDRSAYLFQKYIDKTCSPAEKEEFLDIVKNAADSEVLNLIMDNFWNKSLDIELDENKADAILEKVFSCDAKTAVNRPNISFKWMGWAAAIFIISIAAILINNKATKVERLTNKVRSRQLNKQADELITVSTLDEHQKVTLPDGSTIILNNNSSIKYSSFFAKSRVVTLTGEAYFDIKHDEKKSFIVYAGKLRTTVLGTAFNIKAYENDKNIEVTVTRGKVSVLDSNSTLGVIVPNQQIIYNKNYKKSNLAKVIAKNIVQWQESDLYFDDTSMEEAAQILSKKFNTPITFSNEKAKKCTFTATFLKGESLTEILKIICSYNNAQYQTNTSGITINGEGCE